VCSNGLSTHSGAEGRRSRASANTSTDRGASHNPAQAGYGDGSDSSVARSIRFAALARIGDFSARCNDLVIGVGSAGIEWLLACLACIATRQQRDNNSRSSPGESHLKRRRPSTSRWWRTGDRRQTGCSRLKAARLSIGVAEVRDPMRGVTG
jgi:hypothetical protein